MNRSLKLFTRVLAFVYRLSQQLPAVTAITVLAIAALAATQIPKQQHLISYRDLFDQKFESARRFDDTVEKFGLGNTALLLAKPKQGAWTPRLLCDYHHWILDQKASNPEIDSAISVFNLRETVNTPYSVHYPWILDPHCDDQAEKPIDFSKLDQSPWNGTLYSPKTKDLGVEFTFRDTPGGSHFGKFDPKPIGELIASFNRTFEGTLESVWTGPSMYDYSIRSNVARMRSLNVIVLIILLFLYRAFLGTWRSGLILAVTLILTGMILYGTMSTFGAPMDVLASGLFLMITISAHQDFSYLSSLRPIHSNMQSLFRRFLVPSFFTSLTTIVGFASLGVSEVSMIARFGLWAAFGAALEWCMVLLFLPAALRYIPYMRDWVNDEKIWIRNPLGSKFWNRITPSRSVSRLMLGVFLFVPLAIHHVNFNDDPKNLFEESHSFRRSLDYIFHSRGWDQTLSVVYTADQTKEFKQKTNDFITHDPLVAKIEGSQNLIDYFTKGLNPLDSSMVIRDLKMTGSLDHYEAKNGESRVVVYITSSDQQTVLAFKDRIEAQCPNRECFVTGPIDLYNEFVFQVSRTLVESLVISLAIVILIMAYLIRARGVPHGAELIVSSMWGPALMILIISAAQISINAFTSSFAAIVVGLAGDNSIQFMFAYRKGRLEQSVHSRGGAALFTSAVMAVCSLTFLAAAYRPPKIMGALLFAGFLLNFYGDYALLVGLMKPKESKKLA